MKFNFWAQQQDPKERQQPPVCVRLGIYGKNCTAGGQIRGKISLFVPPSADGCEEFSGIHLCLVGTEMVKLHREMDHRSLWETDKKEVIRIDTEIAPFPSELTAGNYEYPFCWQLPKDKILPVTMSCSSHDDSTCHMHYNVTAYLSYEDSSAPNKFTSTISRKTINVISSGKNVPDNNNSNNDDNNSTSSAEPKTFKLKPWFKSLGIIELGVDTDTEVTSTNSTVDVRITGRGNFSSVPVKKLIIQWIETVEWGGIYNGEREDSRVLAQVVVPVDEEPQWQAQKKSKDDDTTTATADNSDDGNKISRSLRVSKAARESYEGRLIKVKHVVNVTAITKGNHITNPLVTRQIEVIRKPLLRSSGTSSSSSRRTPVMANAQLFSSSSRDNIAFMDDANHKKNEIREDDKLPQAVPINSDGCNDFVANPLVIQGEMVLQNPTCCSSTAIPVDDSESLLLSILSGQQIVEPVAVVAIEE